MKRINLKRGFTLIELLVVVAIIGILASVVLASLNSARSKGADAAIKADLANMRVQAALDYDSNGSSYGLATTTCVLAGTMFVTDPTMASAIAQVTAQAGAGQPNCYVSTNGTTFAMAAVLKTAGAGTYCVDSAGAGKVLVTGTASTVVAGAGASTSAVKGDATGYSCE